jgi:DNA-binding NarL/FixJ family response regulator
MSTPTRILVADDHPVVHDGLVAMLGTQPDFHVVGQAATENEVVEQAAALRSIGSKHPLPDEQL